MSKERIVARKIAANEDRYTGRTEVRARRKVESTIRSRQGGAANDETYFDEEMLMSKDRWVRSMAMAWMAGVVELALILLALSLFFIK